MPAEWVTKRRAAVDQLEHAVGAYTAGAYIPAVTLAGAAEELFRHLADHSAMEKMQDRLSVELGMDAKVVRDDHLNKVRNWLKHSGKGNDGPLFFDARAEALQMIFRAMENMVVYDPSLHPKAEEFVLLVRPVVEAMED